MGETASPETIDDVVLLATDCARTRGKSEYDVSDIALALFKNKNIQELYSLAGITEESLRQAVDEIFPPRTKGKFFKKPDPNLGQVERSVDAEIALRMGRMGGRPGLKEGSVTDLFTHIINPNHAIAPLFQRAKEMGQARRRK